LEEEKFLEITYVEEEDFFNNHLTQSRQNRVETFLWRKQIRVFMSFRLIKWKFMKMMVESSMGESKHEISI
jgi:hypothetical protein